MDEEYFSGDFLLSLKRKRKNTMRNKKRETVSCVKRETVNVLVFKGV